MNYSNNAVTCWTRWFSAGGTHSATSPALRHPTDQRDGIQDRPAYRWTLSPAFEENPALYRLGWSGYQSHGSTLPQTDRVEDSGNRAWESAEILIESGVAHEIRITVHPVLISTSEQVAISTRLHLMGFHQHRLQNCVLEHCLDPELQPKHTH